MTLPGRKSSPSVDFWGGPQDGARMLLADLRGMKNMKIPIPVSVKEKLTDLNSRKPRSHLYVLSQDETQMVYAGQVEDD